MRFIIFSTIILLCLQAAVVSADTFHLKQGDKLESVSPQEQDRVMLDVAEIKKLVNSGEVEAAQKAFDKLKMEHPDIAGPDFDAFIKAEILFCEGKFARAIRAYDMLLIEYPDSPLTEAALSREYDIATAFLAGKKRTVLRFFKIRGYSSGAKIMEKITEQASDSTIGKKAAVAVAKNYEKRRKFAEAYLKWQDISSRWETGQIAKDSLLGMARSKHSVYNKQPVHKRAMYDSSSLSSAKTYYEQFKLKYPEDAEKIRVDDILGYITEQQAYKDYTIGRYYERTDHIQAANLYYSMVIADWQGTQAAELAKERIGLVSGNKEMTK